jgi:hypothetical protein
LKIFIPKTRVQQLLTLFEYRLRCSTQEQRFFMDKEVGNAFGRAGTLGAIWQ